MLMYRKYGTFLFAVLFILVLSLQNSHADTPADTRVAIAIKKPLVGESVNERLLKHLDLTIVWNEMEASLKSTRKFRVLSRNKNVLSAIRDEQKFAESELAKGDAATSGELNNANYLIIPTIQDFKFYRSHTLLPNFDSKYKRRESGVLIVTAQMIDTVTGENVAIFDLKGSFNNKAQIVNNKSGYPSSAEFLKMAKTVSEKLADQVVSNLYPMKVVKRNDLSQVFINRGSDGGLKTGQVLEVFSAGEELIDPDTGISLGVSEEFLGKVKITRVNPKMTVAKILEEKGEGIVIGNILRKPN